MNLPKIIVLGPQCSGKTTLKKNLTGLVSVPVAEEDEWFTELNGGTYPQDVERKEKELRPRLEDRLRSLQSGFFLTSYCDLALLGELKSKGFKIVQLVLAREEFERRNERRMREEGYGDARTWADQIFKFHQDLGETGLVDLAVDAAQPPSEIAAEVAGYVA